MSKGNKSFVLDFKRPKLFSSAFTRKMLDNEGEVFGVTANDVIDTGLSNTSSFRYDPPGAGVRSTQQLPVDWSKFENHTFFNSAEVNVNVAFDRIINEFPFDGTGEEYENFVDSLTGFEKWILDRFPKNKGYLVFSGSHISVNGFAGSTHSSIAKNDTGFLVTDPIEKSVTIEMQLFLTGMTNQNQVICQYVSKRSDGDYGFTVGLNTTSSITSGTVFIAATSGSNYVSSSLLIQKGIFNHLVFSLDRSPGVNTAKIFLDSNLVVTSSTSTELGRFAFTSESLNIGSGSSHAHGASWIPSETFIGYIDEFRLFHSVRTQEEIKKNAKRNIFAGDDLVLYFKFNEPTGSFGSITNIVLDGSGNSLHSNVTNFSASFRLTGALAANPLTYEVGDMNPVLFPMFEVLSSLNTTLLTSASLYDAKNPSLITKLIPKHYLTEGQEADALDTETGNIGDDYTGTGPPGSGELGSTQLLSAFLYVWAKQFDEMKVFADHLPNTSFVSYDDFDGTADQFLPRLFRHYGLDAPMFFNNASVKQFVNSEDIGIDNNVGDLSLQAVQNMIWRRILVNLNDIISSKGTIHSIKALLRAVGVNPESTVRIREYGGSTIRNLDDTSQFRVETSTLLDMSGTLTAATPTVSAQGIPSNRPFIMSPYLTSSRTEVGFPSPAGTFVSKGTYPEHGISNSRSDGLHTSGSWTLETVCKFGYISSGSHPTTQSIARMSTTGSQTSHNVICNLVFCSGSDDTKLKFFSSHISSSASTLVELVLTGVNLFDGQAWSVSFGRQRSDEISVPGSSSWFLRAARQNMGTIAETHTTAAFFIEDGGNSALQTYSPVFNASGSFITIGSQSLVTAAYPSAYFLNDTAITGTEHLSTTFSGKTGHLKFWSKATTIDEWEEHVRNFKSLGVVDPLTNFNFSTQPTGSFQRLRVDASTDQQVTSSDSSGNISIFDFSQGGFHLAGTGFQVSKSVIVPETFRYSFISPYFDEATTDNKIRVRGYSSSANVLKYGASTSPVYSIPLSESPNDDVRFSIDFSAVTALNEDIMRMFATLDSLDNALGDPALLYSEDYPTLEMLRDIYFKRLTGNVNFRGFFEYFKWFDSSMGTFISQLLPRKTKFLGTNFVIESHALERSKIRYSGEEVNITPESRRSSTVTIVDDSTFSV